MTKPNVQETSATRCLTENFGDIDQFSEATRGWDLDFRQLTPSRLDASLSAVIQPHARMEASRFNRRFQQFGATPQGMRTFRKLPRQVDSPKVEDLAFSSASMGVIPPRLSCSRSSLYSSIQAQVISLTSSRSRNRSVPFREVTCLPCVKWRRSRIALLDRRILKPLSGHPMDGLSPLLLLAAARPNAP